MDGTKKIRFQFFQRAAHAQLEFIQNKSVRDKRAPFLILARQDDLQKEFQKKDFQSQMDENFLESEVIFKNEFDQILNANRARKEKLERLQQEIDHFSHKKVTGDAGSHLGSNFNIEASVPAVTEENGEVAFYNECQETFRLKQEEHEDVLNTLLVEEERTESFKKSAIDLTHDKNVLQKRTHDLEKMIEMVDKKLPSFTNKVQEEDYKQTKSKQQYNALNAKLQAEANLHHEEIRRRKDILNRIKRHTHWLVTENVKQKKALDASSSLNKHSILELGRLEEDIEQKKKAQLDSQIVILYAEIIERLFKYYVSEDKQYYKWHILTEAGNYTGLSRSSSFNNFSESPVRSELSSPSLRRRSFSSQMLKDSLLTKSYSRRSSIRKPWKAPDINKLQSYDKDKIAQRLTEMFEKIKMHPEELINKLLVIYDEMQMKDVTLQNRHRELAAEVAKKDEDLTQLGSELNWLRSKESTFVDSEEAFGVQALDEAQKERYYENSLITLKQTLRIVTDKNLGFYDSPAKFVFKSYLFLTELVFRICKIIESVGKIDDFASNFDLIRLGHKIKENLIKLRQGFVQKSSSQREPLNDNVRFSEVILNSEEDSERSLSSVDSASEYSSDVSRIHQGSVKAVPVRSRIHHFTQKFSENVQPFFPHSDAELINLFLQKFPKCQREAEIWSELIRKDKIIYYFTTNKRYSTYLESFAARTDLIERDKSIQALNNIHTLKKESMDIEHTRFAVLFDYLKELYVQAKRTYDHQLTNLQIKTPEFVFTSLPPIKEEIITNPDELRKKTITDFKRRVRLEKTRKLQMHKGEETSRDKPKATISLIQLLQDEISQMREIPNQFSYNIIDDPAAEMDYLKETRQDIQVTMKAPKSDANKSKEENNVPFYLRKDYTEANQLLKKIVHMDSNFKSHVEATKSIHKSMKETNKKLLKEAHKNSHQGDGTKNEKVSDNYSDDHYYTNSKGANTEHLYKKKTELKTHAERFKNLKKITIKPFEPSQPNMSKTSAATPHNYNESSFSREIRQLHINTSSPTNVQAAQLKSVTPTNLSSTRGFLSPKNKLSPHNPMRASQAQLNYKKKYCDTDRPNELSSYSTIANGESFVSPRLTNQSANTLSQSVFKLTPVPAEQDTSRSKSSIYLSDKRAPPALTLQKKADGRDECGNRASLLRNKVKKIGQSSNALNKDSSGASLKSTFSKLDTQVPSHSHISDYGSNRAFTTRSTPKSRPMFFENSENLTSLPDLSERRGYLVPSIETYDLGK